MPRLTAIIGSTPGGAGEGGELAEAEPVGLDRAPGRVQPPRPQVGRADPVLPAVCRHEVAARVADHGHAQLADQRQHVGAQAGGVGGGMAGLEQSGVHTPAEVLDERAEQQRVHLTGGEVRVEEDLGGTG